MDFYERIETLRKNKKISQGKLEETLGFANGLMTKWKNGSLPSADKIINLANFFNVSIDYLLTGKTSNFKLSDTQLELITSFEALDDQQQKVLFELIHCFRMQSERKS